MSDKITLELTSIRHGGRYAICHIFDQRLVRDFSGQVITIKIGFESIAMPMAEFFQLIKAVMAAEATGASYPEDLKALFGLESGQ